MTSSKVNDVIIDNCLYASLLEICIYNMIGYFKNKLKGNSFYGKMIEALINNIYFAV